MNSLGVTILMSSKCSGKCLVLPVTMKSALAVEAHSRRRLSDSSAATAMVRVGLTRRLVLRITSREPAVRAGSSLSWGRRSTSSYSAMMAAEMHMRIILLEAKSKMAAGNPHR